MKQYKNLFVRSFILSTLIIVTSLCWYFGYIPVISNYLSDVENKTYDWLFIVRHNLKLDPKPPENITIVGIDAASIEKVGVPWPWPRQFHASLIDALTTAGAKYIVFDVIFDTISPLSLQTQDISGSDVIAKSQFNAGKEDDTIFSNSIKKAMNILLACEAEPISKSKYHPVVPISTLLEAINNDPSSLGNTSVPYDRDSFVRKAKILFPEHYKDPAVNSSIALRLVQKYLNEKATILPDNKIKIKSRILPSEFQINFYGPSETIKTIPYWKALDLIYSGNYSEFKDQVIFVGRTKLKASIDPFRSVRSPDSFPVPFASLTPNFSGVEIHASIFGNILDNSYIVKMNQGLLIVLIIFIGNIANLIVWKFRTKLVYCFYLCFLFSGIYMVTSFLIFVFNKVFIPPTFPAYGLIMPIYFVNFLDQYFIVDYARRRQSKIFRQLVPAQVADEIDEMDQEQLALGGTRREITVLFTDIKNFTGLCEKYSPETIVNVLNEFFTEMVKTIHKHNGLVDKFIGDAIMAIWGSPKILQRELQANLAAQCALEMKQELKLLNKMWKRAGLEDELSIRIGINTDEAITGNVGSLQRIQFSAIGDGVNVASRLEAINKVYGTEVLISENSIKLMNGSYNLREIDSVLVPGKDIPINIYELITSDDYIPELHKNYSEALKNYRNKNLSEAIKLWQECLSVKQNDNPSKIMLDRTIRLQKTGLPADWVPIWMIENK